MSTEKPDPKKTTEPSVKTTKLPDEETEISDEELEKATGGSVPIKTVADTCGSVCGVTLNRCF